MLGKAIRKAVESFPEDLRVVIFGTGGMSHQLRAARRAHQQQFDKRFLDNLAKDPKKLAKIPHLEYMREAGSEGIELVMWLIMRGALDDDAEGGLSLLHVPASNTAVGHMILENRTTRRGKGKCRCEAGAQGSAPRPAKQGAGAAMKICLAGQGAFGRSISRRSRTSPASRSCRWPAAPAAHRGSRQEMEIPHWTTDLAESLKHGVEAVILTSPTQIHAARASIACAPASMC